MQLPESRSAEQFIADWDEYLRASLQGVDITEDYWDSYNHDLDFIQDDTHKLDRGLPELAAELDLNRKYLGEMLAEKTVLDVGCGIGRIASDIARLKRTRVVALDHDADTLDRVPERKNIEKVLGSGFDLEAAVGDREFDVVISSFSSILWSRSEQEKRSALSGMLRKTASGGMALGVPIVSNPNYRRETADRVVADVLKGSGPERQFGNQHMLQSLSVASFLDLVTLEMLAQWRESGRTSVSYRTSRSNQKRDPRQERYSAIILK